MKAHVEKRKKSKRRWTVEELGNWRVDRRAEREYILHQTRVCGVCRMEKGVDRGGETYWWVQKKN